jgi:hypothetical protein
MLLIIFMFNITVNNTHFADVYASASPSSIAYRSGSHQAFYKASYFTNIVNMLKGSMRELILNRSN